MNGRLQAIVNGYFVSLAPPARLNLSASRAESAGLGPDQTFEFIDLGGHRVALRSAATGKLVCAQDAGTAPLVCDRDEAREWETFELVDLGNSEYALRALVNNKYVCAENAGWDLLIANRDAVGSWETFRLVRLYEPDGLVHELEFVVQMGSDDLRGGRDNIDLLLTRVTDPRGITRTSTVGRPGRPARGHAPMSCSTHRSPPRRSPSSPSPPP